MPDSMIVAPGEFRFDLDVLKVATAARWPHTRYWPHEGDRALSSVGTFNVAEEPDSNDFLEVVFFPEGQMLSVDYRDGEFAATYIAWVTGIPGFPDDGQVFLAEWALEFLPLRPDMTTDEVLAALA